MEGPPRRNPREHDKESSIINQKEERERPSGTTGMENKITNGIKQKGNYKETNNVGTHKMESG